MRALRSFWTRHDGWLTPVAALAGICAVAVGLTVALDAAIGGRASRAPDDWNPSTDRYESCRGRNGVRSLSSSDGYVVAAICGDGFVVKNPYD